jgi:hypothetical protein
MLLYCSTFCSVFPHSSLWFEMFLCGLTCFSTVSLFALWLHMLLYGPTFSYCFTCFLWFHILLYGSTCVSMVPLLAS